MNFPLPSGIWTRARESLAGHAAAVARLYDKWSAGMAVAPWYRDDRIMAVLDGIKSYKPKVILEIGVGDGRVIQRLATRMPDCSFYGVDLSNTMLSAAERRCSQNKNVYLFSGDWIGPVLQRTYDVILVKNTLHLIPNLEEKLFELRKVSLPSTKLVIVETISPSAKSRNFVRSLFKIIDQKNVKLNYFTRQGLLTLLTRTGWKHEYLSVVDQSMSVDDWLNFKVDTEDERVAAKQKILNAPAEIIRQMNIVRNGSRISMLRRQMIVFRRLGPNVVIGPFRSLRS